MKYILALMTVILFTSCDKQSDYERGFQAGKIYSEKVDGSFSKEYKRQLRNYQVDITDSFFYMYDGEHMVAKLPYSQIGKLDSIIQQDNE